MAGPRVYVSITGLKVRHAWRMPLFWVLTLRALAQARRAPGNLSVKAGAIGGVHHTLTVWTDRDAMLAYLTSGAHRDAMRRSADIGTGRVAGFVTDEVPPWAKVPAILAARGHPV
jgi:hypothetical protein